MSNPRDSERPLSSDAQPSSRFRFLALGCVLALASAATQVAATTGEPVMLDQGAHWGSAERNDFYSRDQGSQIMPLRWMAALKQPNGQAFLAASLSRYGYLPNPQSSPPGLPVGFTSASTSTSGGPMIGMTCAACHTRQIEVNGQHYRADGGPAIVDFQSFLRDLDEAVQTVLNQPVAFKKFAAAVLGQNPPAAKVTALKAAVTAWYGPYHTLVQRALPNPAWGPGRLDAVAMIFNRLTGLDIGPAPSHVIASNIQPADAPVRYPFLWNAPVQDKTQWPGFSENGSAILGLARNIGEVYGVFANFKPQKDRWSFLGMDYIGINSANFSGLNALEALVRKIGPPKWPWAINAELAKQGETIFNRPTGSGKSNDQGGCVSCHGMTAGVTRFPDNKTWATPIQDVGTDSREYSILQRTVQTGVMQGAKVPLLTPAIKPVDTAFNVLSLAVLGSILQHYSPLVLNAETDVEKSLHALESKVKSIENTVKKDLHIQSTQAASAPIPTTLHPKQLEELRASFNRSNRLAASSQEKSLPAPASAPAKPTGFAYEARVLQGIWAAAPYLHNGSVPTLADLLKPAADRPLSFKVGPRYDVDAIGLALDQTYFKNAIIKTTDCQQRNSGNSRCGHEFGVGLSAAEKKALLEYLKAL